MHASSLISGMVDQMMKQNFKQIPAVLLTLSLSVISAQANANQPVKQQVVQQNSQPATQQTNQSTIGYLGFAVDSIPAVVKTHFPEEVADAKGLIVTRLADVSPAADDGLKLYDILIAYDEQPLTSANALFAKISAEQPGRSVNLKVIRQGKVRTVPVTIGAQSSAALPQIEKEQYVPLPANAKKKPVSRPQPYVPPTANAANRPLNIVGQPMFPMRKKGEKHAWGDERHIWKDFYTDTTSDIWNDMINAPFKMGRMPGGWRAPSWSMPDPVTIGDAVTNQLPPMFEEAGNMADFSD